MFTFRKQASPATCRWVDPVGASVDARAFLARLRARAATGDTDLAELLDELAEHLGTAGEPARTERISDAATR